MICCFGERLMETPGWFGRDGGSRVIPEQFCPVYRKRPIIVVPRGKIAVYFRFGHHPCRAKFSSPPPCPTPTAPSTSAIWSNTSRPTSGCASRKCAATSAGTSAPTTRTARRSCCAPRRKASRRKQLIARVHGEHSRDFAGFHVGFDNYYTTHSDETRDCADDIYRKLRAAGLIEMRTIEQYYDPVKQHVPAGPLHQGRMPEVPRQGPVRRQLRSLRRHLRADRPDRTRTRPFPAPSRSCAPPSTTSSSSPTRAARAFLRDTGRDSGALQAEAANKMQEWLGADGENKLTDWDISRDAPYFGFEIPDAPGKYFYVWLDAPIGYMGRFKNLCDTQRPRLRRILEAGFDDRAVPLHRQGHPLLPRAVLAGRCWQHAGYRTPTKIFAHGFLTVNGAKMSKSRGTFITARELSRHRPQPGMAALLLRRQAERRAMEDIDLNLDDFVARVNSRPGRQVRQHRQPLGRFHQQALRRPTGRRPAPTCRRSRPFRKPPAASPNSTKRANSPRRCAKSCCWPTPPTSTSTASSPGNWPSRKAAKPNCTPPAATR